MRFGETHATGAHAVLDLSRACRRIGLVMPLRRAGQGGVWRCPVTV